MSAQRSAVSEQRSDLHSAPSASLSPLGELLLTLADDELVLGYWDTEWTGIAPVLEEDVAMSSLAQDEIGHAQALYALLADLSGITPDAWAYGREPDGYRFARLVGRGRGDWATTMARRLLYEAADAVRLAALERSTYAPLAQLVAKMRREEQYHLMHVHAWFERFLDATDATDATAAAGEDVARARYVAALREQLPDALDLFAPPIGEQQLLADGTLPEPMAVLRDRWLAALAPLLERAGVAVDGLTPPDPPRRGGLHPDFAWLHGEMTMVYRQEPGAEW